MRPDVAIVCACALGGCFLPPSLSPEGEADAAPNSVPVILETTFPSGSVLAIRKDEQEPVTITVRDLDLSDDVFVYFYVDYGQPENGPPLNECTGPAGQVDRTLNCDINSLCFSIPLPDTGQHFLEAVVTDQARLRSGSPSNRAFPEGTGISQRAWLMTCRE
ncbi:hypothetical protein [Haliangium ochraceum]|uniref:hypothetical protein n=1 Tax=Haliangium ochraceum TaxID=80816 RepID=UPI001269B6A5|nr:hypothetical protein [Haliangium ochraceum]